MTECRQGLVGGNGSLRAALEASSAHPCPLLPGCYQMSLCFPPYSLSTMMLCLVLDPNGSSYPWAENKGPWANINCFPTEVILERFLTQMWNSDSQAEARGRYPDPRSPFVYSEKWRFLTCQVQGLKCPRETPDREEYTWQDAVALHLCWVSCDPHKLWWLAVRMRPEKDGDLCLETSSGRGAVECGAC